MIPFIFCHIPRTGGTSQYSILKKHTVDFYYPNKTNIPDSKYNLFIDHNDPILILKLLGTEFDNHKLCGFMRDPRDRLVSLYYHLKLDFKISFAYFIQLLINYGAGPIGLYKNKIRSVCCPQIDWMSRAFDFLGKFENLESDWGRFCTFVKIPYEPLPKLNRRKSKVGWKNYYNNSELLKKINIFYRRDLEIGGYSEQI